MTVKRKEDGPLGRTWFRSDRLVEDAGQWYFLTREGSVEGPFEDRIEAIQRLETYTRIARFELLKVEEETELEY